MDINDYTPFDPIKILMLKGEKGEQGGGSYDDTELRELISDETLNREQADASIISRFDFVPFVRMIDDGGTYELPVTCIDDSAITLYSTYSSQKFMDLIQTVEDINIRYTNTTVNALIQDNSILSNKTWSSAGIAGRLDILRVQMQNSIEDVIDPASPSTTKTLSQAAIKGTIETLAPIAAQSLINDSATTSTIKTWSAKKIRNTFTEKLNALFPVDSVYFTTGNWDDSSGAPPWLPGRWEYYGTLTTWLSPSSGGVIYCWIRES